MEHAGLRSQRRICTTCALNVSSNSAAVVLGPIIPHHSVSYCDWTCGRMSSYRKSTFFRTTPLEVEAQKASASWNPYGDFGTHHRALALPVIVIVRVWSLIAVAGSATLFHLTGAHRRHHELSVAILSRSHAMQWARHLCTACPRGRRRMLYF
jgi:hypothetical protein